ncbi:hypothetical protein AGR6A_Cc150114 [Agrobacterium sp. NCPPB 925]|nr:hypothetical protein AGR6A_Cc150114 [Agrobacterium sp. NCPPB 925]
MRFLVAVTLAPAPSSDSLPCETPIQGQCYSYAMKKDKAARWSPFCIVGIGVKLPTSYQPASLWADACECPMV